MLTLLIIMLLVLTIMLMLLIIMLIMLTINLIVSIVRTMLWRPATANSIPVARRGIILIIAGKDGVDSYVICWTTADPNSIIRRPCGVSDLE